MQINQLLHHKAFFFFLNKNIIDLYRIAEETVNYAVCGFFLSQVVPICSLYVTIDYFHHRIINNLLIIFSTNCLVYRRLGKLGQNSQVHRAHGDIFTSCFIKPTVQNPKIISLLSSKTKKMRKYSHFRSCKVEIKRIS